MILKKIKNHINHYGKRIVATALLFVLTTPLVANATEIVKSTRQTLKVNQISSPLGYIWDTNGNKFMFPAKKFSDGSYAYCLEHNKATPNGVTYNSGRNLDNGIAYIIKSQPNTGDWKKDYYVRQGAIHYYLGQCNWIKNAIGDIGLRNKIINLSNEAKKHRNVDKASELSITASPRMNDFKLYSNGYYESNWINVSIKGNLTSYSMDIKNAPKGTQIVNGAGKVVTTLTKNDKRFYLRVPKNNAINTDIKLRLRGNFISDKVVEFIPVQSGYQKVAKLESLPTNQNDKEFVTARLRPTGDFEVVKKNDEGKLLKGATFSIYNVDGVTKYRTQTTGDNGKLKFEKLNVGEYILREYKAPVGHIIKTKDTKIKVNAGSTNTINIVNNIIKGRLKIIKVDEENGDKLLDGAEFDIKDKTTDKVVDHVITDKNGEAITKLLPYGEYYAQETKAPNGYILNGKKYFATITENMQTVTINAVNRLIKGSISIHKIDKETKEGLAGVEFNVLDDKNNVLETVVTDENGNAKTKELPIGNYSFVEVKGLDGYVIDNTPIKVNITESKEYSFTVENEKLTGSMELLKLDEDTKKSMKDVEFKVIGLDGFDKDKEFNLKSNEEGKVVLSGLHKGKFRLIEVKTLDGYILNTEPMDFEIVENGQVVKLEMTNKSKSRPFKIKVIKVNEKNTALEGAEFTLYSDKDCKNEIGKAISNSSGELLFENLKVGVKYYLKETKAPEGYRIPVDSNGKPHVYEVVVTKNNWVTGEFITTIDGKEYNQNSTSGDIHVEGNIKDRVISIQVVNYTSMKLPSTGSKAMIPLIVVGISLIGVSFLLLKKVSRKENRGEYDET
ncbi:LPXTG cell wall anchor domain-containing protein [Clostridium sardiniense]|uniref:LPXTG cell wall anchor domain-containing protein n=1 Tax=Clostridium sardiniense TaxID=29369 RepID=A0ABS7L286_CLOSR|nr:SpaA isopeptide-forming pilin-related protein [Clostridium sardiniense]MBY0757186.1 LPXTG cell wall anchor domain-containing protein [Clostridium sardiniense]MDQ0461638.1 LPXTG-motif cell wall-anchored protein [Clostridium sardiniense]